MGKTKKMLWMKWYPADWINDTRELSPEAKAAWIDILCLMWNAPERGVWKGTYQEFARATGLPCEIAPRIVTELSLKTSRVTKRDTEVTLENRRMVNSETSYKDHAKRQREYRERRKSDRKVTPKSSQDVSRVLISTQKSREKVFVKPTAEELTAYGASIGYPLNAQYFLDHYEANGWRVGKVGMKDWKATVRKWKSNNLENGAAAVPVKPVVIPKYKENVPPAEEVMTADDIRGLKAQIGLIDRTRAPA